MVIEIKAGSQTIKSIDKPSDISYAPDERLELIKTVSGVVVQDGWEGTHENGVGDVISFSCTMDSENFEKLKAITNTREKCNVTIGSIFVSGAVIVLKNYSYNMDFTQYFKVTIEVWRL